MEIIQVIGYKNSGKTTIVAALLHYFSRNGIKTASLKHHGHGGWPLGLDNKDNILHQKAGAIVSGVEGEGLLQFMSQNSWRLEQLISIYKVLEVELLIIEGYKNEDFRKIVLINEEADLPLLDEVKSIIAVVTSISLSESLKWPVFKYGDFITLCEWAGKNYRNKI